MLPVILLHDISNLFSLWTLAAEAECVYSVVFFITAPFSVWIRLLSLSLLLHSRLQTPTGRARCQKPEGPSREDSPVRKENFGKKIQR